MGKVLMVQGTASHVGKSVLVAGLCRLLRQEGLRVAPFKAQNMALNSFATPDGREIGRAQAVQAEAAGVAPSVDMNPILLKPEASSRSQVIVAGRVFGVMDAATYYRRKEELWPIVEASLQRLRAAYDVVVIEGAGSPVEVNLKASDIVNMRVARAAGSPVLLVADIDRGGVFAALVGTMELLEPEERALVAGFIVNKFRGDPTLFQPGVEFLERRLERPVFGVLPWIQDLGIAEEDSQGLPGTRPSEPATDETIDVVVIRLPHIANFDDFDPLARRPGVRVQYVDRAEAVGAPDLIVIPGTKTTRYDLAFMRDRGLDRAVVEHAERGGAIIGVCGGYQMLGERIEDLDGIEGEPGDVDGLGLLPAVTRYAIEKSTVQVHGRVVAENGLFRHAHGQAFDAYEIHMGRTVPQSSSPFKVQEAGGGWRLDGAASHEGRVVGTYVHGLFGTPALLEALLVGLAEGRGLTLPEPTTLDDPYDRLALTLRDHLDVGRLLALVGRGSVAVR
jgi:adenosylcobyric acid synthase